MGRGQSLPKEMWQEEAHKTQIAFVEWMLREQHILPALAVSYYFFHLANYSMSCRQLKTYLPLFLLTSTTRLELENLGAIVSERLV